MKVNDVHPSTKWKLNLVASQSGRRNFMIMCLLVPPPSQLLDIHVLFKLPMFPLSAMSDLACLSERMRGV